MTSSADCCDAVLPLALAQDGGESTKMFVGRGFSHDIRKMARSAFLCAASIAACARFTPAAPGTRFAREQRRIIAHAPEDKIVVA
jgi:hypothetical protein